VQISARTMRSSRIHYLCSLSLFAVRCALSRLPLWLRLAWFEHIVGEVKAANVMSSWLDPEVTVVRK
jgi:hypothetical protein